MTTFSKRIEKIFGCSYAEYLELKNRADQPIRHFVSQRCNATRRGVSWEMGLTQWWMVWQQSGHWDSRGRHAHAYCMCRKGDVGPYAVGNVFIGRFRENSSICPRKKSGLPMGVRPQTGSRNFSAKRRINGREVCLGSYATPKQAHAAYLASVDGVRP
jgi:hypothetical protein